MKRFEPYVFLRELASRWDILAFIVVIGLIAFLGETARGLFAPLAQLEITPLSLDPAHLPEYAARTTFRMLAALFFSLVFTLTYATWAAKSERAGRLLVPILDILQSVPILGFISITSVFFLSLAPGRVLGAEFAAIFAIFTSQAWNMAFSFYQSLRTVPTELIEAAESFRLSPWMRFWQLEVPFGMPALVWNMMLSMSGGWFFVVASESISVGHSAVALPGVGSYIALAIEQKNLRAIGWAILTMLIVILLYDQLLFRPLVAWVDRFRVEQEPGERVPDSWALTMMRRSRLINAATVAFHAAVLWTSRAVKRRRGDTPAIEAARAAEAKSGSAVGVAGDRRGGARALAHRRRAHRQYAAARGLARLRPGGHHHAAGIHFDRLGEPGVGADRNLGRDAASRGANRAADRAIHGCVPGEFAVSHRRVRHRRMEAESGCLLESVDDFGHAVVHLVQHHRRRVDDSGRNALRRRESWASRAGCGGARWRCRPCCRFTSPGPSPLPADRGTPRKSPNWPPGAIRKIRARGLGSYIADAAAADNFHQIVLGVAVMSLFVVIINRLFWRPLYYYAERKYRLT